jgi:hypothetical protein
MNSGNVSEDERINGILKKMVDFQNEKIDSSEELIRKIKEYMNIKKVQTFLKHFLMYLNDEGFYKGKRRQGLESKTTEEPKEPEEENNLTITDFRTEIYDKNIENIKNIITVARIPIKDFTNLITTENREKNYVVNEPIEPTNWIRVNNALRTDSSVDPKIKEELVLKPVFDNSGNFVSLDGKPFIDGSNNIINDPSNPLILQMVIGMKNTILNDEVMAKEEIDLNKKGATPILLKWVKTTGDKPPFKGEVDPSVIIRESNIDGDGNITNIGETNIHLSEEKIKNTDLYEPVAIAAENIGYLLEGHKKDVADGEYSQDVVYDKPHQSSYGVDKIDQLFDQMKKVAMKGGTFKTNKLQKGKKWNYDYSRITGGKGATIHSPDFVDVIINNALKYIYF